MDEIIINKKQKYLLNYLDFHAYDSVYNYSAWDCVVSNINAISLYYNIITDYNDFIRSHITETSVKLSEQNNTNNKMHWNLRTIENAKQILALSFNTDKFNVRTLFDFDINGWQLYQSIDYYMHYIMKSVSNNTMIQFRFNDNKDGYPKYDKLYMMMIQRMS